MKGRCFPLPERQRRIVFIESDEKMVYDKRVFDRGTEEEKTWKRHLKEAEDFMKKM